VATLNQSTTFYIQTQKAENAMSVQVNKEIRTQILSAK